MTKLFRRYLLLIISILASCYGNAQYRANAEEELNVIKEALNIVEYKEPIIYLKKNEKLADSRKKSRLFEKFERGSFYDYRKIDTLPMIDSVTGEATIFVEVIDSLILNDDEKKLIIDNFGMSCTWSDKLFSNSVAVENYKDEFNPINHFNLKKNYIFSFWKPIFFRDDSICLLFILASRGELSKADISFYRKLDDRWQKWINIE